MTILLQASLLENTFLENHKLWWICFQITCEAPQTSVRADVHGYSGFMETVIVRTQRESEIKIQHMQNATQVYLNTALYKYTDLSREQLTYYSVPTYFKLIYLHTRLLPYTVSYIVHLLSSLDSNSFSFISTLHFSHIFLLMLSSYNDLALNKFLMSTQYSFPTLTVPPPSIPFSFL